jgi:predicted  nucleic acid-binding Zn-ribbon protein
LVGVKADHFDQQRLLALADEDVALTQLAHRRRTLPEAAAVQAALEAERALAAAMVRAETEARDLEREVKRMEGDVDVVRQRATRDQQRLEAGGLPAREVTALQHELDSLARRQGDLEDQELELMERQEAADAALRSAQEGARNAEADRARAEQLRDDALADLADATARHEKARADAAAGIPAPLLSLYDRIRQQTGTTGAALLQARQCQGCRIELNGRELGAVRAADPNEVVRCENCGRILVRTGESGL